MTLQSGTHLGPYEILSAIGAGGMGEVWKARDTRLGRIVAIKQLTAPNADRFDKEARAIAALNHPHICQVYDVGPDLTAHVGFRISSADAFRDFALDVVAQLGVELALERASLSIRRHQVIAIPRRA